MHWLLKEKTPSRQRTTTPQGLHWLQWDAPHLPPKLPFHFDDTISTPSNTPIHRPIPLTTPSGIQIQSAVLPQYIHADRQTWDDMVSNISALLCYSDSERRANNKLTYLLTYIYRDLNVVFDKFSGGKSRN